MTSSQRKLSPMPTGPKGEKRPADVIGNAVKVMRIATGEETEDYRGDGQKTLPPKHSDASLALRARQK